MIVHKKTGRIVLISIAAAMLAALAGALPRILAHSSLTTGPFQVGAESCVLVYEDLECSDDIYECQHADGCTRVWQEVHEVCDAPASGLGWALLDETCPGGSEDEPFAAAIWAADVCTAPDGHDFNGWLTLDANTRAPDTKLWVAAGPDGPWYETQFMQPPYVMSYEHTAALAAWVGVADEGQLWFKGGATGIAANLASMIADRAPHMDALCGE